MTLDDWGNVATIVTGSVSLIALAVYWWSRCAKLHRLKKYLKAAKENPPLGQVGQKSIVHIMSRCSMTEGDILNAAFWSKYIRLPVTVDDNGFAKDILLEYDPTGSSK